MGMSLGVTVIAAIYHIAISVIDVDRTIAIHLDVLRMHCRSSPPQIVAWHDRQVSLAVRKLTFMTSRFISQSRLAC